MQQIEYYQETFKNHLKALHQSKEPASLYEPIQYILSLGGKRLRPVLTLMTSEVFGTSCKDALDAAMAVEVFHNFSLIHDDIMDDAPLRRGHQTVHEKWDLNTGILSGDAMLILAYQCFESYDPKTFKSLMSLFSLTALEVCEGQQYDIDFETQKVVSIEEYLKMIAYKTAVLVGAAMKMGAIVAQATEEDQDLIYNYGLSLGIAFQLQDDYLDAFGDPESFGKQLGGDILEHKKTYLYLKTLELGSEDLTQQFLKLMSDEDIDSDTKVSKVKQLYIQSGAQDATLDAVKEYTKRAFDLLNKINVDSDKKNLLRAFGEQLMTRRV